MRTTRSSNHPGLFFHFLTFLLLCFCASIPSFAREGHITILFTNDHHGQVEPVHSSDTSKPIGGVARRMALIEKIRDEVGEKNVVLVDSGDLFIGTAFSELTNGKVDCAAYKLMKYDAVGLGPHDFDYGRKTLLDYRKSFGVPWVTANIVRGGQPFLRPYVLKYSGGIRVGLIGFSNPDTPNLISRENVRGLVFNPPGAAAKGLHSIFKKDADIFVVLSHMGVEADKKFAKDNSFIHVILGGFSRTVLTEPIVTKKKDGSLAGPIIGQAGSQGLYLGRLDLTIAGHRDPKTKNAEYSITDYQYKLIPITTDLPEEPEMVALLDKYRVSLKSKPLTEVLATAVGEVPLTVREDSVLGQMTTDAIRNAAEAELALVNSGFFHSDFKTGALTREILYEILPVDDQVVTLELLGSQVRKVLEMAEAQRGQDGFLQVSGLRIEKKGDSLDIWVGDEPLKDKKKYLVAVNDFLAGGGDGYDLFRRVKNRRKTGVMLRSLLEETLRSKQKLVATDLQKRWSLP